MLQQCCYNFCNFAVRTGLNNVIWISTRIICLYIHVHRRYILLILNKFKWWLFLHLYFRLRMLILSCNNVHKTSLMSWILLAVFIHSSLEKIYNIGGKFLWYFVSSKLYTEYVRCKIFDYRCESLKFFLQIHFYKIFP